MANEAQSVGEREARGFYPLIQNLWWGADMGMVPTKEAKAGETKRLAAYGNKAGVGPEGNTMSFRPKLLFERCCGNYSKRLIMSRQTSAPVVTAPFSEVSYLA